MNDTYPSGRILSASNPTPDQDACQVPGSDQDRVERGRALLHDDSTYAELADTFRALADSSRAKIVYSLLHQELCTCDLAAITNISESAVSQHLRVLRQLRLVKSRRDGKLVFYSLDDAHIRILLMVCLNHVHDAERQHNDVAAMEAFMDHADEVPAQPASANGRQPD